MNSDQTTVIRTYATLAEANFAKDALEQNGIASFVSDSNVVQLYPMFGQTSSGIRLLVLKKDAERAEDILKEIE